MSKSIQTATRFPGGNPSPEPPPIPKSTPVETESQDYDSQVPDDALFTAGLLRFLVVSFAVVTVLLAANVFIVLQSDSETLAQTTRVKHKTSPVAEYQTGPDLNIEAPDRETGIAEPFQDIKQDLHHEILHQTGTPDSPNKNSITQPVAAKPTYVEVKEIEQAVDGFLVATRYQAALWIKNSVETELPQQPLIIAKNSLATAKPQTKIETCPTGPSVGKDQTGNKNTAPYYGTKIEWNRLVEDASEKAKSQNKLVFLIHVSGNFTKEEFT